MRDGGKKRGRERDRVIENGQRHSVNTEKMKSLREGRRQNQRDQRKKEAEEETDNINGWERKRKKKRKEAI